MGSGAQNAVMGDQDSPTELPVTAIEDAMLVEEKSMAKYSKTDEYKRITKFVEGRIKFFQTYLPNGQAIASQVPNEDLAHHWAAANIVIGEFQAFLNAYEDARKAVDDLARRKNA